MAEQCICVENLTKSFGNRRVIDDLSFDVKQGEVFERVGVQLQHTQYQSESSFGLERTLRLFSSRRNSSSSKGSSMVLSSQLERCMAFEIVNPFIPS